jgi:SAM-dependent methyltransferase
VTAVDGSAESIPLADGAVDTVTAAQAFHWFDNEQAIAEIARVLVPGGIFAPIWNVRDESVDWVREMSFIIEPGTGVATSVHTRAGRDFGPRFERPERAEFRHDPVLHTTRSLLEHARSRSPYLSASLEERRRMEARLTALVHDLPQPFELPYFTVAFRARRHA